MASPVSAGLLMCRWNRSLLEFFLVHPGGPFFAKRNEGVWTIPKGLVNANEILIDAAQREFMEETGITPHPPFWELGSIKLKSGKIVHGWAFWGSWHESEGISCNTFELQWPPRSGKILHFPEIDRAAWMDYNTAIAMIHPNQIPFIARATQILKPS